MEYKDTYYWPTALHCTLHRLFSSSILSNHFGLWPFHCPLYCCSCFARALVPCPMDTGIPSRALLVVCLSLPTWLYARVWATTPWGYLTCLDTNRQPKLSSRAPAGCHSLPESATRTPASSSARSSLPCALRGKMALTVDTLSLWFVGTMTSDAKWWYGGLRMHTFSQFGNTEFAAILIYRIVL